MSQTVFLNGLPMHTCGELPRVGTQAPEFVLVKNDLSEISLHDYRGNRVVLNIFPSLDTDVCAASVRRFNKEASELENTRVICVSMDLPFAAGKFCAANGINNVITASAFRSDFGKEYGVEIVDGPMRGLFARCLVVLNEEGKVIATSLCDQITEEPDYELVKQVLK